MTKKYASALQMRNISLLLGDKENWKQRLVALAFGQDICDKALAANYKNLEAAKKFLVTYYESLFTDEDWAMEIALKKAKEPVYENEEDI